MQCKEVFSFYFPLSCCLALVEIYAGLNPYAYLGALTLYNRIGFDCSRGSQRPKLRTRVAPDDLRFISRADERMPAFLALESVKQRFQRVRFCSRFHCSSWRNWWSTTSGCAPWWGPL